VIGAWKTYLDAQSRQKDSVFAAYRAFAAVSDKEFATKAKDVIARLGAEKAHLAVVAALERKRPTRFKDVCDVYAELLAQPGDDKALAAALGPGGPLDFSDQTFR